VVARFDEPDTPGLFALMVIDGRPTVRGECDVANVAEFEAWLSTFGAAAIEVDLSGVTFFGATALRALLAAARRNPNLRIVKPSAIVRRVLELTGSTGLQARTEPVRRDASP